MDVSELPPTGPTASGQHLDAEIWTHSFSMGGMDPHVGVAPELEETPLPPVETHANFPSTLSLRHFDIAAHVVTA